MEYYYSREDVAFYAASPLHVVEWLQNGSRFCVDETVEEYIKGCAEREKLYSGKTLRYDSPENFVADLLKHEILTVLKD